MKCIPEMQSWIFSTVTPVFNFLFQHFFRIIFRNIKFKLISFICIINTIFCNITNASLLTNVMYSCWLKVIIHFLLNSRKSQLINISDIRKHNVPDALGMKLTLFIEITKLRIQQVLQVKQWCNDRSWHAVPVISPLPDRTCPTLGF